MQSLLTSFAKERWDLSPNRSCQQWHPFPSPPDAFGGEASQRARRRNLAWRYVDPRRCPWIYDELCGLSPTRKCDSAKQRGLFQTFCFLVTLARNLSDRVAKKMWREIGLLNWTGNLTFRTLKLLLGCYLIRFMRNCKRKGMHN